MKQRVAKKILRYKDKLAYSPRQRHQADETMRTLEKRRMRGPSPQGIPKGGE